VWVDDGRDITQQAGELPIWTEGQPALRVIVRSPDSSSRGTGASPVLGPRLKLMVAALKGASGAKPVAFWSGGWWLADPVPARNEPAILQPSGR
jgi:hypothetical protein